MREPRDTTGNDALDVCPNCDTPRVIGRHGSSDCIVALRAELAEANREIVRLGVVRDGLIGASDRLEAELERVTTERDDAYALIRHYADTDPEVALAERMRPVVEAADAAVDADRQMYHGTAEHAEANMEATFTALYDAVDAYRVATSEQEADDA